MSKDVLTEYFTRGNRARIFASVLLTLAGLQAVYSQLPSQNAQVETVELIEAENLLFVNGRINSREGLLMIDTGSGYSVIDHSSESDQEPGKFLVNTQVTSESNSKILRKVYEPPFTFKIGKTTLPLHVIYSDLGGYRELTQQNIIAIVGGSSFRGRSVEFDFAKREFSLAEMFEDLDFVDSAKVRFRLNFGMPTLRANLMIANMDIMLDSGGAFELALPENVFDALVALDMLEITGRKTSLRGLGVIATEPTGILDEVTIGGRHYGSLQTLRVRSEYPLVGSSFLKRFERVAFDYPSNTFYLGTPVLNKVSPPKPVDLLGLLLSYKGERRFVAAFSADTPIAQAGMLVGDEILEVDKIPVSQGPKINKLISEKGNARQGITFTISRQGSVFDIVVTPRDFITEYITNARAAAWPRLVDSARTRSSDGSAAWLVEQVLETKKLPKDASLIAEELLKQSSESGNAAGQWLYGMRLAKNSRREQAIDLVSKSAAKGHSEAQLTMGTWAERGYLQGTADAQLALEWYRKAALGGNPKGALATGELLLQSNDPGRALGWFLISRELGSTEVESSISKLQASVGTELREVADGVLSEFFADYSKDPFMKF